MLYDLLSIHDSISHECQYPQPSSGLVPFLACVGADTCSVHATYPMNPDNTGRVGN